MSPTATTSRMAQIQGFTSAASLDVSGAGLAGRSESVSDASVFLRSGCSCSVRDSRCWYTRDATYLRVASEHQRVQEPGGRSGEAVTAHMKSRTTDIPRLIFKMSPRT